MPLSDAALLLLLERWRGDGCCSSLWIAICVHQLNDERNRMEIGHQAFALEGRLAKTSANISDSMTNECKGDINTSSFWLLHHIVHPK